MACRTSSDVAGRAGLTQPIVYGGVEHKKYILETIGCGVAFFDYDNDGWLDIFAPRRHAARRRSARAPATACTRTIATAPSPMSPRRPASTATGWASGVCVGDYNNDGFDDLFLTCWGQNVLYRNNGDGTFTDVTEASRPAARRRPRGAPAAPFVDYNRDGHLDLFVSQLSRFRSRRPCPLPGADANCMWKGIPVNCGPRACRTGRNCLYRNNGDGTFTDVSEASGHRAKSTSGYAMTAVAADFDNDGWPDIYVACDSTPSLLYQEQSRRHVHRRWRSKRGVALQRRRHGAGRHGSRRRRLQPRRQSRHLQDPLRRRHHRPVSQRRQGHLRDVTIASRAGRARPATSAGAPDWRTSTTTACPICSS